MSTGAVGPVEVLLIEDSPDDAALMARTLARAAPRSRVRIVDGGAQALDVLHRRGEHAAAAVPDLILLDLNLLGTDGRALLEEIKQDEHLRRIPVVVVSASLLEADVVRSYRMHANAYVAKPAAPAELERVIYAVVQFWLRVVRLP